MELLILLVLAAWGGARYSANGAVATARKTEPLRIAERRQRAAQSHERRMARMARRDRRSTPTVAEAISIRIAERVANPRGGPGQEAMALWWADSWGYATERRRQRHQRAADGQLGRQKAARAVRGWATRWWQRRTPQGATTEHQTGQNTTTGDHARARAGRVWAESEVIKEESEDIVDAVLVDDGSTAGESEASGQPAAAHTPPPPGPSGQASDGPDWYRVEVRWADGSTHEDGIRAATPAEAETNARRNWITDTPGEPAAGITVQGPGEGPWAGPEQDLPVNLDAQVPVAETEHHPIDPTTDDQPTTGAAIASVHPIRRDTTMTSTLDLTHGETLDPHAGKALADQLNALATQCVSTVEQSSSSLTEAGVAGRPIELLGRLQEAFSIAASACEEIGAEFTRHQGIQDQVLSDSSLAGTVRDGYLGRA
jgi:hypothetical protein